MANEEVRSNVEGIKLSDQSYTDDPVGEIMWATDSLRIIASGLEDQHEYGQSNLLLLIANQLAGASEALDEQNWQPTRKIN